MTIEWFPWDNRVVPTSARSHMHTHSNHFPPLLHSHPGDTWPEIYSEYKAMTGQQGPAWHLTEEHVRMPFTVGKALSYALPCMFKESTTGSGQIRLKLQLIPCPLTQVVASIHEQKNIGHQAIPIPDGDVLDLMGSESATDVLRKGQSTKRTIFPFPSSPSPSSRSQGCSPSKSTPSRI